MQMEMEMQSQMQMRLWDPCNSHKPFWLPTYE
ncbi:hypothetical protein CGLO_12170 [Colletotrichum gloeosporioides Cg-14]|uniref:Uncharacterized protein n=1 Tax=Colletotrichum gloeosporioides (strain Cg-14) TaxID=1237896 RepID=T0LA73_COLGC|nr:hypothetical protein CGLO_12170 [Colletotrichum gloeosporioides Cg-14]